MAKPIGNGKSKEMNGKSNAALDRSWLVTLDDGGFLFENQGDEENNQKINFEGTDRNDFIYIDPILGSEGTYDETYPTIIDGGGGADQIIMMEEAIIGDAFFTNMDNITVLKLWDGNDADDEYEFTGSQVNLAEEAQEAGIREVTGGPGDDVIEFTDAFDETDVLVEGSDGDDIITTAGGDDSVYGGDGNDGIDAGAGADTLIGGNGADFLRGDSFSLDGTNGGNDLIFAGSQTTATDGVYAEGNDVDLTGAGNSALIEDKFNHPGDPSGFWEDFGARLFEDANALEGREGDDVLVASNQTDAFIYQFDNNSGRGGDTYDGDRELATDELGTDTIHNFKIGQDYLVFMDQEAGEVTTNGVGPASPDDGEDNWSAVTPSDMGSQWSLNFDVDAGTATLTFDPDETTDSGDELSINLVGVQNLSDYTTVDDFFFTGV